MSLTGGDEAALAMRRGSAGEAALKPLDLPTSMHRRRWMLLVLILATALSSIDRQVLPLLLEQIKSAFSLSDTQLGALTGPAFFLLYAFCALPPLSS